MERFLAYSLVISPPIAVLLMIAQLVRHRSRLSELGRVPWTLSILAGLVLLGIISMLVAESRTVAIQGPVGLLLLLAYWFVGRYGIAESRRFWVDLQRAIGLVAMLALTAIVTKVDVRIVAGPVKAIIISPEHTATVFGLGENGLGPLLTYGTVLAIGRLYEGTTLWNRLEALLIAVLAVPTTMFLGVRNALWGSVVGAISLLPATGALGLVFITAVASITMWLQPAIWTTFAAALRPETEQQRLLVWQNALRMIHEHPWFGVGPFHFVQARGALPDWADPTLGAHNIYLKMASEWGLPAAILLFAWLFSWPVRLWRYRKETWRWSLVAGLLAFLSMGLFDDPLFTLHISASVFVGLGLAAARPTDNHVRGPGSGVRPTDDVLGPESGVRSQPRQ